MSSASDHNNNNTTTSSQNYKSLFTLKLNPFVKDFYLHLQDLNLSLSDLRIYYCRGRQQQQNSDAGSSHNSHLPTDSNASHLPFVYANSKILQKANDWSQYDKSFVSMYSLGTGGDDNNNADNNSCWNGDKSSLVTAKHPIEMEDSFRVVRVQEDCDTELIETVLKHMSYPHNDSDDSKRCMVQIQPASQWHKISHDDLVEALKFLSLCKDWKVPAIEWNNLKQTIEHMIWMYNQWWIHEVAEKDQLEFIRQFLNEAGIDLESSSDEAVKMESNNSDEAYKHFFSEHEAEVSKKEEVKTDGHVDPVKLQTAVAKLWEALPREERKKYEHAAAEKKHSTASDKKDINQSLFTFNFPEKNSVGSFASNQGEFKFGPIASGAGEKSDAEKKNPFSASSSPKESTFAAGSGEAEKEKSGFSFDYGSSATEAPKPNQFSFGGSSSSAESSTAKPFSFGSNSQSNSAADSSTPISFSFGSNSQPSSKPSAATTNTNGPRKKAKSNDKQEAHFTFGKFTPASEEKEDDKKAADSDSSNPQPTEFTFGPKATTTKLPQRHSICLCAQKLRDTLKKKEMRKFKLQKLTPRPLQMGILQLYYEHYPSNPHIDWFLMIHGAPNSGVSRKAYRNSFSNMNSNNVPSMYKQALKTSRIADAIFRRTFFDVAEERKQVSHSGGKQSHHHHHRHRLS